MTLERQAEAVHALLASRLAPDDRQALVQVANTLDGLIVLQRKCLAGAGEQDTGAFSDEICHDIMQLLQLPTEA